MTWWTIFTTGGAEVARNVASAETPSAASCGIDMRGKVAKPQPRRLRADAFEAVDFATGRLVEDLERARAWALAKVDRERAVAGGAALTVGESVTLAYARAGAEALDHASLTAAVLLTIDSVAKRRKRFPWLVANIEERGLDVTAANLKAVADEVLAGKAASEGRIMKVEGRARRAKLAVRAAATVAAVQAAATVNWSI